MVHECQRLTFDLEARDRLRRPKIDAKRLHGDETFEGGQLLRAIDSAHPAGGNSTFDAKWTDGVAGSEIIDVVIGEHRRGVTGTRATKGLEEIDDELSSMFRIASEGFIEQLFDSSFVVWHEKTCVR